jgi:hypothetical protein
LSEFRPSGTPVADKGKEATNRTKTDLKIGSVDSPRFVLHHSAILETAGLILALLPLVSEVIQFAGPSNVLLPPGAKLERRDFVLELGEMHLYLRFFFLDMITEKLVLNQEMTQVMTDHSPDPHIFHSMWEIVVKDHLEVLTVALGSSLNKIQCFVRNFSHFLEVMLHVPSGSVMDTIRGVLDHKNATVLYLKENLSEDFDFARPSLARQSLLHQVKDDVILLKSLSQGQGQFEEEEMIQSSTEGVLRELDRYRRYSYVIYDSFSQLWDCPCHRLLMAMLFLDRIEQSPSNEFLFSLIFIFQTDDSRECIQETNISVSDTYFPFKVFTNSECSRTAIDYSADQDVRRLCPQLSENVKYGETGCKRIIELRLESSGDYYLRKETATDHVFREKDRRSRISLESLLRNPQKFRMTSRDTYRHLAVNIASSILRLSGTPWLQDTWSKDSIFFMSPQSLAEAYVMSNTMPRNSETTRNIRGTNPCLVAFGIILLELAECRPFEEWLEENEYGVQATSDNISKSAYAMEWLEDSKHRMAITRNYAAVVSQCLQGCSRWITASRTLDSPDLQDAFYRHILMPLVREEMWSRTPLV